MGRGVKLSGWIHKRPSFFLSYHQPIIHRDLPPPSSPPPQKKMRRKKTWLRK